MALIQVLTTAGATLQEQAKLSGTVPTIDRIEIGQGNVTTVAAAKALNSLVTPYSPVRQVIDPPGSYANGVVQFVYQILPTGSEVIVYEAAAFAGSVLTHYLCDDAGAAVRSGSGNTTFNFAMVFNVDSVDNPGYNFNGTFTVVPMATTEQPGVGLLAEAADINTPPSIPKLLSTDNLSDITSDVVQASETQRGTIEIATTDEANAGNDRSRAVTPFGLAYVLDRLSALRIPNISASKITSGVFSSARIPGLAASKITSGVFSVARIPPLAASKITSGIFDIARIGSGPKNSGTVLHGDNVFRAVDSGLNVDNPTVNTGSPASSAPEDISSVDYSANDLLAIFLTGGAQFSDVRTAIIRFGDIPTGSPWLRMDFHFDGSSSTSSYTRIWRSGSRLRWSSSRTVGDNFINIRVFKLGTAS